MLKLTLLVALPLQVVGFIVDVVLAGSPQAVPGDLLAIGTAANRHVNAGALSAGDAITWFIGVFATALCTRAASEIHLGRRADVGDALRFTLGRIGAVLWLSVLLGVGLFIGYLALIVPGIYLYAAWSVAVPVLLLEGLGARKSLSRSRALVKGRWWRVAGVILASNLIVIILADGFSLAVLAVIGRGPTVLSAAVVINVALAVAAIVVNPFRAAVVTVLYYDLQSRPLAAVETAKAAPSATPREEPTPPRPARTVAAAVEVLPEMTRGEKAFNRGLVTVLGVTLLASVVAVRVFGA
ncbi:MAG TPA: hypothetical protein VGG41_14275 [Solirubrobacteraceae bacterium]|jgi:hypothetical protein